LKEEKKFLNMAHYRNNNGYDADDSYGSSVAAAASNAQYSSAGSQGQAQSYDGYSPNEPGPFDLNSIQLPAPNAGCYQPPGDLKGQVKYVKHDDQNETKSVEQNLSDVKEVVRENVVHHQHNKNVLINVNRNHNHLIKVVNRDHNLHHHLINNIVRVNDIHRQKIEEVRGEGRTSKDYKQTHRVEAGGCKRADDGGSSAAYAAASSDDSGSAGAVAAAAWQAQSSGASAAYGQQASYGANYGSSGYGYAQQANNGAARYGQYRQY
jgi:ribosomal protein S17